MTPIFKNLWCLSIVYIRSNSKLFIKTFYDKGMSSSIHILLSFFSFSIPYQQHINTHRHLSQYVGIYFHHRLSNSTHRSTQASPLITLTHINFSVLCMPQLYSICVVLLDIMVFSAASDFSSKIVSSWALSSTYFLSPQRTLSY